jgi:hypothetical protein
MGDIINMNINCFDASRVVLIILMFLIPAHIFLSRYIIDELYKKMGDNFFNLFPDLKNSSIDFNTRTMKGKTHSQLIKVILWNKNNIRLFIGKKQKYFVVISILILIFITILFSLSFCFIQS